MSLLYTPRMQFVDLNGAPYAFATAQFYDTGTTTPSTIYSDAGLTTTQTNPMTADDKGLFPAVYLDENAEYRLVVKSQDGSVTILDVDPVNELLQVGAAQIEDGAIEAKLGYTPVNPDAAVFTSPARNTFSAPVTALHEDDVGFRANFVNIKDADYTFDLDDSYALMVHDDASNYAWTIPPNSSIAFPIGTKIVMSVQNTGIITLTRGSGVTLRVAGSATSADLTLAQYTFGYIEQVATDVWVFFGQVAPLTSVVNANRTMLLGDNGDTFVHDDANPYSYTLDPHSSTAYPVGFEFRAVNIGAGTLTIARGSGVALRKAGSSTNADIAIAQWGMWFVKQVEQDVWMATGAG